MRVAELQLLPCLLKPLHQQLFADNAVSECARIPASLSLSLCAGDGKLTVNLQKALKAETWPSVFQGHGTVSWTEHEVYWLAPNGLTSVVFYAVHCCFLVQLDAATVGEEQKTLMLERFQAEHPGFDFSGAEFSGAAPDPRTFMGGVHKH